METQFTLPAMDAARDANSPADDPANSQQSLRIYTLGRFTLVRDGQPVHFARKSPVKPLLLLKGLIATGGRQVGAAKLASIIWPDKEGDLAQRTFETTLHRLRKYLGDDRYLVMENGCLTLNSDRVWVDVWECERQFTKLRGLLAHHMDAGKVNEVSLCADQIMRIYQGHFLAREQTTCWSVSLEERLRSRFVHSMLAMGRFWEQEGLPAKAVVCYQRGIDVDDLIETFYQRLMLCLHRTGRQPEAMACYRSCEHVLAVSLGLQPTEETQQIYHSILSRYQQQAC